MNELRGDKTWNACCLPVFNFEWAFSIVGDELLNLLDIAIGAILELEDTVYSSCDRPADFVSDLRIMHSGLASGDHNSLQQLRLIFAPTGEWDDCVGTGKAVGELANRVSELLQDRLEAIAAF